jgi:FkbM family methyltransferase
VGELHHNLLARCPQAPRLDRSPWRAALKDQALHAAIPLARACVRYRRAGPGRERLWRDRIEPYLAWHSHRFSARTVFGSRLKGDTQEILQQHVYYFGVWEPNLTRWLQSRLQAGDVFVDVGANVGYFTLLASRLVGERGSVVAIEASPTIYGRLSANLARNRASNVRALNRVAAREAGRRTVYIGPASHTGLTTIHAGAGWPAEGDADAASVPELVGDAAWRSARLIKIDVEGAEDEVIAGMAGALARTRPELELVVELHPGSGAELFATLREAGFHGYALEIDYSPLSYGRAGAPPAARRVEAPPPDELDVIFSRRDVEAL